MKEAQAELVKVNSHTKAATDGVREFRRLIAEGSPAERRKLQTEIRYRVDRIYCYRAGIINEEGIILNTTPAIEIEYHFGVSSIILIGTDNPIRNPSNKKQETNLSKSGKSSSADSPAR